MLGKIKKQIISEKDLVALCRKDMRDDIMLRMLLYLIRLESEEVYKQFNDELIAIETMAIQKAKEEYAKW